ncbi:DUF2577 domain-containing protein [Paenibacillus alvei]|uniref:DUF2577 domain-containing protein n=1 Tax=Paenibacillus alvei TaxID=44250 RepID=A0ABT4E7X7_PAEAL|nr:DUF2577 family protein [Paenibacillus alvei]MCY9529175.1 DUF2577 domain-containing protein [Paenibacillus alvei]
MESWEVQFAQLFKERNNPKKTGIVAATIIDPLPNMRISLGEEIILDMDQLVVANRVYQLKELKQGDQVVLVPTTNEQQYYVIDKVGE